MYIKQVIIQGFKSFREQTVLEPFDPRHNVVVGRNGSGKSNFFDAIQFVLSDDYSRLRSDQLQGLLHEGIGPRVISAHVEIIFDNSDGRLPIDKTEVYVRRLFGSKKDQYFLNAKLVTRNEVMSLLESAGFSKSNPYYIVKQGKISQMTTAPDSQRLKLLREVAGTRVYEDRCRESKNLLKETEGKFEKIDELLMTIVERLRILEEEKEELKAYQKLDNERRYLEYTIYDRELKENKKKLRDLEKFHDSKDPVRILLNDDFKAAQEAVRSAVKSLKEAKKEVASIKEERDVLIAEQQELQKQYAKLKLTGSDLREELSSDNDSKKRAAEELEMLRIEIASRERELESIKPQYEEIKSVEEECTRELTQKEQKRKEIYAKLGRVALFTNKESRDEWIQGELKQLEKQIDDKKEHQAKMSKYLELDAQKQISLNSEIEAFTFQIEKCMASIKSRNKDYEDAARVKDQCQALRKEQYREDSNLQRDLEELKEDLRKADQNLRSMVGSSTLNGRDSVKKVIDIFREREDTASLVNGYHGLVIDNFNCERSIYTAVEVTAGNRLFNHVVDTDSFATKILAEMNNHSLPGEASFMPINRIKSQVPNYPDSDDAIPMIAKIDYDPMFDNIFRYIFGRTLICRNVEAATILARSSGLDCVTMEGDQVSSRGTLTGGYFDTSRSRMAAQRDRMHLISQIRDLEDKLKTLKEEIFKTEQDIVAKVTEMQKTDNINSKTKDRLEQFRAQIRLTKTELATLERSRASKEQSLAQCALSLKEIIATKESLESELKQELTSELSDEDQRQIDMLNEDIRRLTQENKEAFAKRMRLEADKNKLENLLVNNLVRRRDELVQAMQELSFEDRERKLQFIKTQLDTVKNSLEKVGKDLEAQTEKLSIATKQQKEQSAELCKLRLVEKVTQEKIDDNVKELEKMASKQNMIQRRINELTKKIAELEALPNPETYHKLNKLATKELMKRIENVNKELKQYSEVNKRALDQFVSFTDQKESLSKRKAELDVGAEKIKELMMVLEQRKYEAIEFTFKQVSKYFSEIFEQLVPSGHAYLVMQTNNGEEETAAEFSSESALDADRFSGIGIRVSFTGQNTETREMNQLSGGQKSLVALTLIFAIQKCDPAPFYLFDEIDQALDTEHRVAVANMIHELSDNAQFIITTFRPELLTHANKFYGVRFRNKVSHIECVTREEAADFVEDDTSIE